MAKDVAVLEIGATPFNLLFTIYPAVESGSDVWSFHRGAAKKNSQYNKLGLNTR